MTEKSSVSDLKRQITLTGKSVNNLKRPSYLDRKKRVLLLQRTLLKYLFLLRYTEICYICNSIVAIHFASGV